MAAEQSNSAPSERPLDEVLRDQAIVVPMDAEVWALVGRHIWTDVHSNTPPCFCRACREGGSR